MNECMPGVVSLHFILIAMWCLNFFPAAKAQKHFKVTEVKVGGAKGNTCYNVTIHHTVTVSVT